MLDRTSWRPSLAWLAAALVGCGFSPSGAAPTAVDAGDAGIDAPCQPGCSVFGDEAVTCSADGQTVRTACPYGCIDRPGAPVCAPTLVPANVDPETLATFDLDQVGGGLPTEIGTRIAIDTDLGAIYKFSSTGVVTGIRPAVQGISNNIGFEWVSPTLSVLAVLELRVVAGSTVEVFGSHSLVILTRLDAIVDGTIRADGGTCSAFLRLPGCNGPGAGHGGGQGGTNASGCAPGGNGSNGALDTGGAGGGMATSGGDGGTSGTAIGGVTAADLSACAPAGLVPLIGGGGGGRAAVAGGNGGGGGGALQITSYGTLRLSATAVVSAVGAGGEGTVVANAGGGGGGAGGAILLEAPTVEVLGGAISTAGGGGGGGRLVGATGQAGRIDGMPALGGIGDGTTATDGLGGNGAINSVAALAGSSNQAGTLDGTGGGGGGLGRIRINNLRGDAVDGARFVGRFSAGRTQRRPPP